MSTQLIPVFTGEISNTSQPLCDARTLYDFLGVTYNFGNWIANRIKQYQFIENTDFLIYIKNYNNPHSAGRSSKQYHLTFDMAKELAMVERNDKGREARRYFIDCEKRLHSQHQLTDTLEHKQAQQFATLKRYALRVNPVWQAISRYKAMGLNHAEIGKLVGLNVSTIRRQVRSMEASGLLATPTQLDLLAHDAQEV